MCYRLKRLQMGTLRCEGCLGDPMIHPFAQVSVAESVFSSRPVCEKDRERPSLVGSGRDVDRMS